MGVTLQQIAEKAGVSRGTVDRALNNRGRIKPEVAEKRKKIAEAGDDKAVCAYRSDSAICGYALYEEGFEGY